MPEKTQAARHVATALHALVGQAPWAKAVKEAYRGPGRLVVVSLSEPVVEDAPDVPLEIKSAFVAAVNELLLDPAFLREVGRVSEEPVKRLRLQVQGKDVRLSYSAKVGAGVYVSLSDQMRACSSCAAQSHTGALPSGWRFAKVIETCDAEEHAARRQNPGLVRFDEYEYLVSNSFLPALINGDSSNLNDADVKALDAWLARLPAGKGHIAVVEDDAGFGRCAISGLGSDRAKIAWMVPKTERKKRKNPSDEYSEGFSWDSPTGRKTIVRHGTHPSRGHRVVFVQTAGRGQTLDVEDAATIAATVAFDERAAAQRSASSVAAAERAATAATLSPTLSAFVAGMTPLAKKRAIDVLRKQIAWNGLLAPRHAGIEQRVSKGWSVATRGGSRRFTAPDGGFLNENDISKTAMDYAEFLTRRQNPSKKPEADLPSALRALDARIANMDENEQAYTSIHKLVRPTLSRHLGGALGPSADWLNTTWSLGDDLFLTESDSTDGYTVLRMEGDEIEEVRTLADVAALARYFSSPRRQNPAPASRRLVGVGMLDLSGDRAAVDVTKEFASEWDGGLLNQAPLTREVLKQMKAAKTGYQGAVDLRYRGRTFTRISTSAVRENPASASRAKQTETLHRVVKGERFLKAATVSSKGVLAKGRSDLEGLTTTASIDEASAWPLSRALVIADMFADSYVDRVEVALRQTEERWAK